jgi:hypothetical protein
VSKGTLWSCGLAGRVMVGLMTSTTSISTRNWTRTSSRWLVCPVAERAFLPMWCGCEARSRRVPDRRRGCRSRTLRRWLGGLCSILGRQGLRACRMCPRWRLRRRRQGTLGCSRAGCRGSCRTSTGLERSLRHGRRRRLSTAAECWLWHKFRDRVLLIILCPLWRTLRHCYRTWRPCV